LISDNDFAAAKRFCHTSLSKFFLINRIAFIEPHFHAYTAAKHATEESEFFIASLNSSTRSSRETANKFAALIAAFARTRSSEKAQFFIIGQTSPRAPIATSGSNKAFF